MVRISICQWKALKVRDMMTSHVPRILLGMRSGYRDELVRGPRF